MQIEPRADPSNQLFIVPFKKIFQRLQNLLFCFHVVFLSFYVAGDERPNATPATDGSSLRRGASQAIVPTYAACDPRHPHQTIASKPFDRCRESVGRCKLGSDFVSDFSIPVTQSDITAIRKADIVCTLVIVANPFGVGLDEFEILLIELSLNVSVI